jgi:hypothetical protein
MKTGIFLIKSGQSVTHSRTLARIAAFFKLSARGGAPFVNAAGGFFAHFATQCTAAWWRVVGATHAAHRGGELLPQACGDRAAMRVHFFHAEVHPKTGAASAAAGASRHVY